MKTLFLLFTLVLFKIVFCQAQINPNIKWENALGGPSFDYGKSVCQTLDGGFIVAGSVGSNGGDVIGDHSKGGTDAWIVKLTKDGKPQWAKCYGGSNSDAAVSIKQTTDGGYIFTASTDSHNGDVTGFHPCKHFCYNSVVDYWVVKLDSTGTIEWENCFGGSDYDLPYDVEQTKDGGYIVTGLSYSTDGDVTKSYGGGDVWIIKLNSDGKLQWQKSYGGSNYDIATSIKQLSDGGYIFLSSSNSVDGEVTGHFGTTAHSDYWVVSIDSIGNIKWQKSFGGTGDEGSGSISGNPDGDFVIAGTSNSIDGEVTGNHGGYDYWIIKIDSNGNLLRQISLGGSSDDVAFSIKALHKGGFVVAGFTQSNDGDVTGFHGFYDYWIVQLSSKLKFKGEVSLGGSLKDVAYDVVQTSSKDYVIAGSTESDDGDVTGLHNSQGNFYDDYWVVWLKQSALSTQDERSSMAKESELSQNEINIYPTITTGTFQINLQTTTTTDQLVNIEVFNSIGQLILTKQTEMINGTLETKIELNPLLPGGMYFVKTSLSNQQYIGKILLARER